MTEPVETPAAAPEPATDVHTGGMLALVPSNPEQYVVTGGDPAEQLHVTLAFLGDDVSTLPEAVTAALRAVAGQIASSYAPITATISGHAVWNPDSTEFEPCAVYELESGYPLGDIQDYASWKSREAMGEALFPDQHRPFKPHMTAGWGIGADSLTATGEVVLGTLRLALGGETVDYPLSGFVGEEMYGGDYYTAKAVLTAAGTPEVPEPVEGETPPEIPKPDLTAEDGIAVRLVVALEGIETSDGRFIVPGSLTHRALPLSILAQTRTPDGGDGHDGADVIGRMDTLTRVPGPSMVSKETGEPFPEGSFVWVATGYIDPEEKGTRLVQKRYLTGNSVDLSEVEAEFIFDDSEEYTEQIRVTSGKIAATTLVTIPAFADAFIQLDGETLTPAPEVAAVAASAAWTSADVGDECVPCLAGLDLAPAPVTAAAAPALMFPPIAWFADPQFDEYCPLTLRDDPSGLIEVFGHLGEWGTCHTGFTGQCITMPKSPTDYSYFHVGAVRAQDGDTLREVSAGHITMGEGGHAGLGLSAVDAAAYYDNVNTVVADVTAGEDAHGIWIHGFVRRTATPEQVEALRASPISGDWRPFNGGPLELVAALAVNSGGFPVPRARVASGVPMALVAAGMVRPVKVETPEPVELAEQVADLVMAKMQAAAKRRADEVLTVELTLRARAARARMGL